MNEFLTTLKSNWSVPKDKVTVKVENGWVTLDGELPWNFEKEAANRAINYLMGVKGITNNIQIKSDSLNTIEKIDVENAISRSWSVNDNNINVKVSDTTVYYYGNSNFLVSKRRSCSYCLENFLEFGMSHKRIRN